MKKNLLVFLICCVMRIIERGLVNTALCQLEFPPWSEFKCSVNRIQLLFVNYKYRLYKGVYFLEKYFPIPVSFLPSAFMLAERYFFLFVRWIGEKIWVIKWIKNAFWCQNFLLFPQIIKKRFWKYLSLYRLIWINSIENTELQFN